MILNPLPSIVSSHQIKIRDKEELVGRGLGYLKFMTKVAKDKTPFHMMSISHHYMKCQLPNTIL